MCIIRCEGVNRDYKVVKFGSGWFSFFKSFFNPDVVIKRAINDFNISINKGEIVGIIGPNGAGKSTFIKLITGILNPDSGNVSLFGLDPFSNRKKVNKKIGVFFGQRTQLLWDLPVIDSFEMLKYLYNINSDNFAHNISLFSDYFDRKDLLSTPVRQLSLGQRVCCDIMASFLHDPELIILDEPTIGLDFIIKKKVLDFIRFINKHFNTTVLFTSHNLFDVSVLCNRIVILNSGNIIFDNSINVLKESFKNDLKVVVTTQECFGNLDCLNDFGVVDVIDDFSFSIVISEHDLSDLTSFLFKRFKIKSVEEKAIDIEFIVRRLLNYDK